MQKLDSKDVTSLSFINFVNKLNGKSRIWDRESYIGGHGNDVSAEGIAGQLSGNAEGVEDFFDFGRYLSFKKIQNLFVIIIIVLI